MGITRLNTFLKDKSPNAFIKLPYSYFKGKRVVIDSDNLLMKFMCRAHKQIVNKTNVVVEELDRKEIVKTWIYHVQSFINAWLNHGVTIIFVFDGEYIPEKSETQKKRKESKKKTSDTADDYKCKIMELDELERTPAMITELRKKMHNMGYISREEKQLIKDIINATGIPVLHASGEGEKLCAMLCVEGKVDAAYSRDTDLLAFGTPLSITEEAGYVYNPVTGTTEETLKCVNFKPILGDLNLNFKSFVDLCIMSGCDFNINIPHIGITKVYKYLTKYQCIENIRGDIKKCKNVRHPNCIDFFSRDEYDGMERVRVDDMKNVLNYERCREIFKHVPSDNISDKITIDINPTTMFNQESQDILKENGLSDWINNLMFYYKHLPKPSDYHVPRYPSLASSRLRLNIMCKTDDNSNNYETDTDDEVVVAEVSGNNEVVKNDEVGNDDKVVNTIKKIEPNNNVFGNVYTSKKSIKTSTIKNLNMMQQQRFL